MRSLIGERLRSLREGVRFSQLQIGKMLGLTQASIQRYESGQSEPPLQTLRWYADHFDVSLDYIYGRTDKPQGTLYEYRPKLIENNPEMRQFIEMCFDPSSPMNDRLKQTLMEMIGEVKK